MSIIVPCGWEDLFNNFKKDLDDIILLLVEEINKGVIIYPSLNLILRPFYEVPFNKVRVIILGQDPYHNPNQANGLAFSVNKGIPIPPSLKNIYSELKEEIPSFEIPKHGDLTNWCNQGILLLNSALTVEKSRSRSHDMLWYGFIKRCMQKCSKKGNIIFVLWGKNALKYEKEIDESRNIVLKAAHPSPYSANKGFFGCNHFKQINKYLNNQIDWSL